MVGTQYPPCWYIFGNQVNTQLVKLYFRSPSLISSDEQSPAEDFLRNDVSGVKKVEETDIDGLFRLVADLKQKDLNEYKRKIEEKRSRQEVSKTVEDESNKTLDHNGKSDRKSKGNNDSMVYQARLHFSSRDGTAKKSTGT